jgi:hypothetical protein
MAYEILETCMLVPGVSAANCAGWVQAWGSLIAVAIAIWIPLAIRQADQLARKAEAATAARLVAEDVYLMLEPAIGYLNSIRDDRQTVPAGEHKAGMAALYLKVINATALPTSGQLLALSALGPVVAPALARASSYVVQLRSMLGVLVLQDEIGAPPLEGQLRVLTICCTRGADAFNQARLVLKEIIGPITDAGEASAVSDPTPGI